MVINDTGDVIGQAFQSASSYHAFLYRGPPGAGVLHDLGTLDGIYNSLATDVNKAAQVTGGSSVADFVSHAFRYTGTRGAGGQMVDLGTLGTPFENGMGYAINDSGFIVGRAAGSDTGPSRPLAPRQQYRGPQRLAKRSSESSLRCAGRRRMMVNGRIGGTG